MCLLCPDQTASLPIRIPFTLVILDRLSLVAQWAKQFVLFFSFFPFHFFFSHKRDPERYEEPLFFQQQLASARTSTEVSAAKPTPSIDTTHEDGGRCSSRRKLRGISFGEKKKKKREDNHLKQAFVFLSFTKYILFSSLKPSVRHSGVRFIPPHSVLWNLLRSAPKNTKEVTHKQSQTLESRS